MSEPIIIDGVKIEKCKYSEILYGGVCCNRPNLYEYCRENPECDFKQLQRLKKELEIKEKQSEHFMIGSGEVLDKLRQENKRLQQLSCPNCGEKLLNPTGAELYDKVLDYKQALEEIKNIAELEVMFGENSKAFYPTNIQRILDVINEVLNEQK